MLSLSTGMPGEILQIQSLKPKLTGKSVSNPLPLHVAFNGHHQYIVISPMHA